MKALASKFVTMTTANEEVWCDVSDDEMYNPCKDKKGTWQPKAEDILSVFEQLKSKKVLDLHWKCPGRRHPDSDVKEAEETREEKTSMPNKQEEKKPTIPNEFDFDDDDICGGSKTVLTPRRTPGSAPKSQKKEAKMDKILKDMMYQRKLQAAEREARKLAGAKSPRTAAGPGRARIGSPAGSPRTPNRQSPVRLGAGPADHITTTPVRAALDQQTALRVSKMEPNTNLNVGHHRTYDTTGNLSTSQNIQTSQTGTTGSNTYAYQSQSTQSQSATVGETILAQNMIKNVTASPQVLDQSQERKPQPSRTNETRPETSQMKPQPSRTNETRPETSQMKPQPSRTNETRPEMSQMKPQPSRTNETRPEMSQMKPQPSRTNETRPETSQMKPQPSRTNETRPEMSQMKPQPSRTNETRPETSQMKPQPSRTNETRPEISQMKPQPSRTNETRPESTITNTELLETPDKMDTS